MDGSQHLSGRDDAHCHSCYKGKTGRMHWSSIVWAHHKTCRFSSFGRRELPVKYEEFGSIMQKDPKEAFQTKNVSEMSMGFVKVII